MISEAFHTLNQPLTGLHCGLEIALQKPRSEGEYRHRISAGLENAGAILQLVKAVRQLVDSADPGERLGTVNVPMLISQLRGELEVVAEAAQIKLEIHDGANVTLLADPGKLMTALGSLVSAEIESYEAGGVVNIATAVRTKWLDLGVRGAGSKKEASAGLMEKLAEIRRNAAYCYLWILGGEVQVIGEECRVSLPLAE
jgi:signal transduction histidine kinase